MKLLPQDSLSCNRSNECVPPDFNLILRIAGKRTLYPRPTCLSTFLSGANAMTFLCSAGERSGKMILGLPWKSSLFSWDTEALDGYLEQEHLDYKRPLLSLVSRQSDQGVASSFYFPSGFLGFSAAIPIGKWTQSSCVFDGLRNHLFSIPTAKHHWYVSCPSIEYPVASPP